MRQDTKFDIRCKICGRKLFIIKTPGEMVIEVKCNSCKIINLITLTKDDKVATIEVT